MLREHVYPVIWGFILFVVMIIVILMTLRLIFNYTDPNPFGYVGKFAYSLKKFTDRIVYPSAGLLAHLRIDTRIAPLLTILGAIVIGYFILQLFYYLFFTIDGVGKELIGGSVSKIVGYLLYGGLNLYSLAIVIRIVLSWVMSSTNPILRFLRRITDPILEPFRRIIPPLGMFDISPIVVLLLLSFLQAAVWGVFGLSV
jgi:YggT family protein